LIKIDTEPGGIIEAKPFSKGQLEGSFYYFPKWAKGSVQLNKSRLLTDQLIQYNIFNNTLELRSEKTKLTFYLVCEDIVAFTLIDSLSNEHKFTNTKEYPSISKKSSDKMQGFFEILVEGSHTKLLSKTDISILKSNYNVALDSGDKNDKIIKNESLYFLNNDHLLKIPKNKKEIIDLFIPYTAEINETISSRGLNIKSKEGLVEIVHYYIQLIQ
jgi:hypothetical protein